MPSNCCVPGCFVNSKHYVLLNFYNFPSNKKKFKLWDRLVRNSCLLKVPKICSLHFAGEEKTYDVDTPTIFPWTDEWFTVVTRYNTRATEWFKHRTQNDHSYSKFPRKLKCESFRKPVAKWSTRTSLRASLQSNTIGASSSDICFIDDSIPESSTLSNSDTIDCTDDVGASSSDLSFIDDPIPESLSLKTVDCPEVGASSSANDEPPSCNKHKNFTSTADVVYYEKTHLLVNDQLQTLLSEIQRHTTQKTDQKNDTLQKLLLTVILLLQNVKELYDTITELNGVNKFTLGKFTGSDKEIRFWTGFPSHSSLKFFIDNFVLPNAAQIKYWGANNKADVEDGLERDKCGPKRTLRPEEELFLTLIKLRRGSATEDLAERFSISSSHVSRIFITWVNFLYHLLTIIDIWMSQKKVKRMLPESFKGLYDDVLIVLDCTEMECERPSDLELQAATYSSYKSRNTVKGLVGISPNGIPTFVSDSMEGSVSDNDITAKSGILDKLPKGCAIMADRGWTNKDALARKGVRLVSPSFLMGKKQLDLPSLVESVAIARVGIHVERCMGHIKQWLILKQTLPLTEWRIINHIWKVCVYLVLFWPPLVDDLSEDNVL